MIAENDRVPQRSNKKNLKAASLGNVLALRRPETLGGSSLHALSKDVQLHVFLRCTSGSTHTILINHTSDWNVTMAGPGVEQCGCWRGRRWQLNGSNLKETYAERVELRLLI